MAVWFLGASGWLSAEMGGREDKTVSVTWAGDDPWLSQNHKSMS